MKTQPVIGDRTFFSVKRSSLVLFLPSQNASSLETLDSLALCATT